MYKTLLLLFFSLLACSSSVEEPPKNYTTIHQEALAFCQAKGFNQEFYFLIDFSVHSGKNRFYVYDFNSQKVVDQNLVTHGSCDVLAENPNKYKKATFSNANGSHCSSKGKYKIGKRDYSSWGIHVKYWLHGLEPTNTNAEKRVVVLHSWEAVSNEEIFPRYAPLSWGCPAVSDAFMKVLDEKLKVVNQPVLLWIVE
jgi:L,D-transpeptidase catalytic domain